LYTESKSTKQPVNESHTVRCLYRGTDYSGWAVGPPFLVGGDEYVVNAGCREANCTDFNRPRL
jgi:hypothetical protein